MGCVFTKAMKGPCGPIGAISVIAIIAMAVAWGITSQSSIISGQDDMFEFINNLPDDKTTGDHADVITEVELDKVKFAVRSNKEGVLEVVIDKSAQGDDVKTVSRQTAEEMIAAINTDDNAETLTSEKFKKAKFEVGYEDGELKIFLKSVSTTGDSSKKTPPPATGITFNDIISAVDPTEKGGNDDSMISTEELGSVKFAVSEDGIISINTTTDTSGDIVAQEGVTLMDGLYEAMNKTPEDDITDQDMSGVELFAESGDPAEAEEVKQWIIKSRVVQQRRRLMTIPGVPRIA